jgi:hypothetical protein
LFGEYEMQTSRYQIKTGLTGLTVTQKLLVAAPILLIASMIGVFQLSAAVLGADRGYVLASWSTGLHGA